MFENGDYKLIGGESANEVLQRGLSTFLNLLTQHTGKTFVLGTHGIIMTLLLRSFDPHIGFDFWKQLQKPDVYRVSFEIDRTCVIQQVEF